MTQIRLRDKQVASRSHLSGSLSLRILLIAFFLLILPLIVYAIFVLADLSQNLVLQEASPRILQHLLALFLLILALGGSITWWLVRRMTKPLKSLNNVMARVEEGHIHARFQKDLFGFEINFLGEHFNRTLDALIEQMEEAKRERLGRERLLSELKIGHEIQKSILPKKLPAFPGLKIAAGFVAATEVAGDFYDLFEQENLMISIGDASGKGISACLYAFLLRSMLRAFSSSSSDLAEIIQKTNSLFSLDTGDSGYFVTAWFALFDPSKETLHYTSCGHLPALLLRKDQPIQELSTPGVALGAMSIEQVEVSSLKLQPKDKVILYTDGILEAHDKEGALYGKERLYQRIESVGDLSAQKLVDHILEDVRTFSHGARQHDDITLLVLEVCNTIPG